MKCILLAAGYATRLYPLTKDRPKPLLEIGKRTILDRILDKITKVNKIDDIYIVTNARFFSHFNKWLHDFEKIQKSQRQRIHILNDGSTDNENRLGAIADLLFVIDQMSIEDDLLVMAADNLFDFELTDFVRFFHQVGHDCITVHELHDREALQRTGVVQLDSDCRVINFVEKPNNPPSNLAVPPFYLYKSDIGDYIRQYLDEGNNPDAPGNFIPWLITKRDVYAYHFEGNRYDIGTHESYEEAQKLFGLGSE